MKFITKKNVDLANDKMGIKLSVRPATNAVRFTIYDIGSDESLAGKVKMAEYIYQNCIAKMSVKGESIKPAAMISADLSDSDTAEVYFEVVNLVATELLGSSDEAEVKK